MAVSNKTYKYEDELKEFDPQLKTCPPSSAAGKTIIGYRWVKSPMTTKDFLPPGKITPSRLNGPKRSCGLMAVSLHTSVQNSVDAMHDLEGHFENARRVLGNFVASGQITPAHGRCTNVNRVGHFDLHEYANVSLVGAFRIIQKIPPGARP